jgi:hypothetical protein
VGQTPPIFRETFFNQWNDSLANAGVLTLCKQGHHQGKLHPRVPVKWVIRGIFPITITVMIRSE